MRTFQLVLIEGATPYERGVQYGRQAKEKIRSGVEGYRRFFARTGGRSWESMTNYALSCVPLIDGLMPELLEEARGIADGAEVSFEELMILNCRYEITKFPREQECTTCAVLPEASRGGNTLLVKNWDYRAGILDNIVVLHIKEPDGTQVVGLTEAGQLIREGFNSHGVGLCNNALQSVDDAEGTGIPVTFLRRKIFSCRSFEEAKQLLLTTKRSVSNNMLLASKDGRAVDIEAHPNGCDILEPKDGILTHANHFVANPRRNALEESPRGDRLKRLLRKRRGDLDVDSIKMCMCDHENYPKAICRHPSEVDIPLDHRGITVACMIVDFGENAAHICQGPPCEGEFVKYSMQ
jgi:isopenicillin-N N-acyltransferase-like protein